MNLQIFRETEYVYLFSCTVNVNICIHFYIKKNRRFVLIKLVKLSDKFVEYLRAAKSSILKDTVIIYLKSKKLYF